jgi:antirestriction protein ArdC
MKRDDAMKLAETALEQLAQALEQGHSETLKTYLKTLARFHRYSFGNVLLIACQRPDATHVAGFHTWKKLGRSVRRGEKGIAILAPIVARARIDTNDRRAEEGEEPEHTQAKAVRGFVAVHVFDVNQTEGEPLPEFAGITGTPGQHLEQMRAAIHGHGIRLEYAPIPGGALGVSEGGTIKVTPNLQPAEEFAILAHELAHELLHKGERRHRTTKTIRETEAEAVAFVVCNAVGMESTTRRAQPTTSSSTAATRTRSPSRWSTSRRRQPQS